MSKEQPYVDSYTEKVRNIAFKVGTVIFLGGIFSKDILDLSHDQDLLLNGVVLSGIVATALPVICDIQDYRKFLKNKGKDDKDNGGSGDDWPDDDDDPTPDVPDDPGGLSIEWVEDIEEFLRSEDKQLVSVD